MADDVMLQEAIQAVRNEEPLRARDLLTRLIKSNPGRAEYWLWMSAVVDTEKERLYCLQEAYQRDPTNPNVLRGLAIQGAYPADQPRPAAAPLVRRAWQPVLPEPPKKTARPLTVGRLLFILAWSIAGVTLVGLAYLLITHPSERTSSLFVRPPAMSTARPSATFIATNSPVVRTTTPTFIGPTPLWMFLEQTYTPTPIYVNTPHPRSEAYRAGMRAFQRGDWAEARSFMLQVIETEPDAVDAYYYLGEAYRSEGDYANAIEQYNAALKLNDQFAPAYLGRAKAQRENGEAASLVENDLEKAFSLDPALVEAGVELAHQAVLRGAAEDALQILDNLEEAQVSSPWIDLYRAEANLALGDTAQALAAAQRANQADQTLLEGYLILAQAEQASGEVEQSAEPLEVYLRYQVGDADAWAMLGKAYAGAGREQDAMRAFDQSLSLDTNNFEAYLLRGQIYLDLGENQKAVDDLYAAISLEENSFAANLGLGRALLALDYPGDAYLRINRTQGLARSDEQRAQVYYWRAMALEALDRSVAARADWISLASLPTAAVSPEWLAEAAARLTPTPTTTLTPSVTRTQRSTPSLTPSRTSRVTATPQASLTLPATSGTAALSPTPAPSLTRTP